MSSRKKLLDRIWFPSVLAGVVALGMLWLARGPFGGGDGAPAGVRGLALVEPSPGAALDGFPERFEWAEVRDALAYEITVARLVPAPADSAARPFVEEPVFRQRGATTRLDLHFEPGAEPGPGRYRWRIRALRRGGGVTRTQSEFLVREPGAGG